MSLSGPMRWQGGERADRDEVPRYLKWGQENGSEEKGNEQGFWREHLPWVGNEMVRL